jgi:hypothetical protein
MDRNDRKNKRAPQGFGFLMWPALVRAPWLIGELTEPDEVRRGPDGRRKRDR